MIIVDEFTGRLMPGRQWSDGLHQAVEAKEGVKIKEETQTLATITLQNFFKLYGKICGMTGTAMTEAGEFWKIYKLDVIAIPTNRPMRRVNNPDVIYMTEREKFNAVADEIERIHKWDILELADGNEVLGSIHNEAGDAISIEQKETRQRENIPKSKVKEVYRKGRPVLVGTVSIEKERAAQLAVGKARYPAPSAQRQAPQARGGDRRAGRAAGRSDHCHEHGRPRHRHCAGRQRGNDGMGDPAR